MADQRMVPVELLNDCLREAGYVENFNLVKRLRAIIDGPGVEPVGHDWSHFDIAYQKACNTSQGQDWLDAALLAQQVRNQAPSAPAQAVPDVEEVRRRFEREYVVNPQTYRRNEYGDYVLPSIQDAWAGWKAAMLAALTSEKENERG